jgi:capsular polysaccharide biosynthesis protein
MCTKREPKQTVYIINSFIKAFIEESNRIIVNGKIEIVDSATLPETPVKPNKLLNIIIVFAISLITCVGIVFVIEYFDDTIKNEIDIEKYLGLSVIGTIPKK